MKGLYFDNAIKSATNLTRFFLPLRTDRYDNVYVAGTFTGTTEIENIKLVSSGNEDIFIVKYNSCGELLWARKAGGAENDACFGMSIDTEGNCYLTGSFQGKARFGHIELTSFGDDDGYIVKYDSDGIFQWAKQMGNVKMDRGEGIDVDCCGNSYVTGFFTGTARFDDITITSLLLEDLFIAKYDTCGELIWVRQGAGTGTSTDDSSAINGSSISIDNEGNSYIGGIFIGTVVIGGVTLTSDPDIIDLFITKYDSDGTFQWVEQVKGINGSSRPLKISTDCEGNNYIIGFFTNSIVFDNSVTLTSFGLRDVFIAKYDTFGNFKWARQAGGIESDDGFGITNDCSNVYVTGFFSGTATFGNETINSVNGSRDIFVAKYDVDGNFINVIHTGSDQTDSGSSLDFDSNGNLINSGVFNGTVKFGDDILTTDSNTLYIAKIRNSIHC